MKQNNVANTLPDDLLVNPDFYLYDLDFRENTANFVLMNRDCYKSSPFLDIRMSRVNQDIHSISLDELTGLAAATPRQARPVKYIFHHGACGSTLISRCLDIKGLSFSIREPVALHQLALARRNINDTSKQEVGSWRHLLDVVLRLLSRTYDDSETVIIKPSDWCNNIIPDLLRVHNNSSAILVYRSLYSFMLSTLKSPEGRGWMRKCLAKALHDLSEMGLMSGIKADQLADSEVTACVWMAEMYGFMKQLDADSTQTRSLLGDDFMNDPLNSLARITEYFCLAADGDLLNEITGGAAFHLDSKISGKSFDKDENEKRKTLLAENLSGEMEQGLSFMKNITGHHPIPETLPLGV